MSDSINTPAPTEPVRRNWKKFSIRVSLSLIVLAVLFYLLPRDKLLSALRGFSVEIWLAGVSAYLCLHLIGVAKWRMLINTAGASLTFSQACRCYYYGLFGNTFLPSVVGGDIIRAGLALKMARSKSAVLMGSVVDRTIDTLGLAAVAGIGALFVPVALNAGSRNIFWGFAALIIIGSLLLALLIYLFPARRLPYKIRRKLVKVRNAIRALLKHPGRVIVAFIAVMALQTSQVVMNLWLGRLALIFNATFLMWLFVWPLAKMAAMVPLTQGGIGVREAAQGALFLPFGVSIEKAVATGLIFQAIIISGNLLGGVIATLLGQLVPSAAASVQANPAILKKDAHRLGILLATVTGGSLFFVANTLAIAYGTGSINAGWVAWMNLIPGYAPSFTGSIVGLVYGIVIGYSAGRIGHRLVVK